VFVLWVVFNAADKPGKPRFS